MSKPAIQALSATGRTVPYCRVSTDAQAEDGQSLEVQRRQLEGWAMQRGQQLDEVIVEPGVSGAIPFHERGDPLAPMKW
jgi:DNA invertase Pin-like site-specific DNA recombinase